MTVEVDSIKNIIREAVKKYTGISIEDDEKNLLSSDYQAILADFLYVLKALEDQYGSCIYQVFKTHNYTIFTVNNLAYAIAEVVSVTAS